MVLVVVVVVVVVRWQRTAKNKGTTSEKCKKPDSRERAALFEPEKVDWDRLTATPGPRSGGDA